jgi:hypothetical protein
MLDHNNQELKNVSLFSKENFTHYMEVASKMSGSEMVPKNYRGKPMDILIAMEMGQQVGLSMMQAVQNIAVINGKPCMYGDALLAVAQGHPSYEWIKEEPIFQGTNIVGYKCIVKRKHHDEHIYCFTIEDAKKASLWGRSGPWTQYPSRMLQMRARGFALRNTFADALQGIQTIEEAEDLKVIDADYQPKQSQSEKMNLLLSKKGTNNGPMEPGETIQSNADSIHSTSNSHRVDDVPNTHSLSQIKTAYEECQRTNDAIIGIGEPSANASGEAKGFGPITEEQLESIDFLLHEKQFDKARQLKALDYFNVQSFAQLSESQGEEMIKILNKVDMKNDS